MPTITNASRVAILSALLLTSAGGRVCASGTAGVPPGGRPERTV